MNISKELLSEVLPVRKVTNIEGIKQNILTYRHLGTAINSDTINIHELAHKCKEWAVKKYSYGIDSGVGALNNKVESYSCSVYTTPYPNPKYFEANSEPEAIFKACEWILEQKVTHG